MDIVIEQKGDILEGSWKIGIAGRIPKEATDSDIELMRKQIIDSIKRRVAEEGLSKELTTETNILLKDLEVRFSEHCPIGSVITNPENLKTLLEIEKGEKDELPRDIKKA